MIYFYPGTAQFSRSKATAESVVSSRVTVGTAWGSRNAAERGGDTWGHWDFKSALMISSAAERKRWKHPCCGCWWLLQKTGIHAARNRMEIGHGFPSTWPPVFPLVMILRAALIALLLKNPPAMQGTPVWFWIGKIHWRRDRLPTPVFLGFSCSSAGKESACSVGDLSSIPGLGRLPGDGKGYPLQHSGLENSMDCIVSTGWQRVGHEWATFTFMILRSFATRSRMVLCSS